MESGTGMVIRGVVRETTRPPAPGCGRLPGGRRFLPLLTAALVSSLFAAGCAGSPAGPAPVTATQEPKAQMRRILSAAPDLSWETSPLLPQGGYWHVPGGQSGPGFFLSRNGFHYAEPEEYALSYERTEEGFTLIEVKKRSGNRTLAQCPAFFEVADCVERHSLMLATTLVCTANSSCAYRFLVFDAYSPFLILRRDHPLAATMKRLADDRSPLPGIDVKFEKSGVIFDTDFAWAGFLADRFAFITREIRTAQLPQGFRFRSAFLW